LGGAGGVAAEVEHAVRAGALAVAVARQAVGLRGAHGSLAVEGGAVGHLRAGLPRGAGTAGEGAVDPPAVHVSLAAGLHPVDARAAGAGVVAEAVPVLAVGIDRAVLGVGALGAGPAAVHVGLAAVPHAVRARGRLARPARADVVAA